MPYSEPKELIKAKQLIDEGNHSKALQLLKNFKKRENNSVQDIISCLLFKCTLYLQQGLYEKAVNIAKQAYKKSSDLEKDILSVDILVTLAEALIDNYNYVEVNDIIKQGEDLLKTLTQELPKNYQKREASIAYVRGSYYEQNGKFDLALEHFKYSLSLQEKIGAKHEAVKSLLQIGWVIGVYYGELDQALNYVKRGLDLAKENKMKYYTALGLNNLAALFNLKGEIDKSFLIFEESIMIFKELKNKARVARVLNNLGENYKKKGDLDRALEYLEQSLAINNEEGFYLYSANCHDFLIQILVERGDFKRAKQALNDLAQLNKQIKSKRINLSYLSNKALILKNSNRIIDRGKAEEILNLIIEDEDADFEVIINALLNLCDLLLSELQMTGDLEVLEEVKSLIARLLKIIEKSHSYWIWGETYLLQAKLALLSLNLKEARLLLTQGQNIAEKYGLDLLAKKISNEHDELLTQLKIWENYKNSNPSLSERLKQARVYEQMGNMARNRIVEVPEISDEEPILLLIISEGGTPFFSQSFVEDQIFEDHLFGGFFTAINSFINEKFSKGLDRAMFGEYTLFMNSVSQFFICYVFKGQSYSALHRIRYFIEEIQKDNDIWNTFEECYQICKEIQLKDIPSLKHLIKEIFIDKTIHLTH